MTKPAMRSRFTAINRYGEEELRQLKNSKALIIGLGATGSVIAEHLARHGVQLKLIDRDYLETNDLYSSNIYTAQDCRKTMPKAKAAEKHLSEITEVEGIIKDFNKEDERLVKEADVILDGTDNLKTRKIIEYFAKKHETPWIYTAAISNQGYSLFLDQKTCFNCIVPENAKNLATCETDGIMREKSTIVASKSSQKAINHLTNKEVDKNLYIDSLEKNLEIENQNCDCEISDIEESRVSGVCGEDKYQVDGSFDLKNEKSKLENVLDIESSNDYLVRGVFRNREIVLFRDGRAIIEAKSLGQAKSTYTKITGTQ